MQIKTDEEQVSIPALVKIVTISVIGTFVMTLYFGIILGLLCGIKYMQKKLKTTNSKQNDNKVNVTRSMKGPEYEEVELENKADIIDLSKNIAYEQVKTVS